MQRKLVVSPSPHLRNAKASTQGIMADVLLALRPSALASVWIYGTQAAILIAVAVLSAVAAEGLYQRHAKQRSTVSDLSAAVTGLLVAFNIPASAPWWLAMVGSVLAIVLVKQMFGGIGQNFINPALAARTILMLSWTGLMAANAVPLNGSWLTGAHSAVDAVAAATPLASGVDAVASATQAPLSQSYTLWRLFSGDIPGMLGETCKLTLLLGGLYLIVRGVIDWRIPVSFIATVALLFYIKTGVFYSVESCSQNVLYQLLSGGLILGAFFMATDYVTSPMTGLGRVIMGVGCGVMLFVIRAYNTSYPEGCSFAILFLNILTPLIDRYTKPRSFGVVKPPKPQKAQDQQEVKQA